MFYVKPNCTHGKTLEVLLFLKGTEYNQNALNYIHFLRPSRIGVLKPGGGRILNAVRWRVWVYVDENNIIEKIEQEGEIGCD